MRKAVLIISVLCFITALTSCSKVDKPADAGTKIKVVASLYPVYDFARVVGGERVKVELILPPGIEPHSFDPLPADIAGLNKADIFIYANKYMEPWIDDIIKSIDNKKVLLLDSSRGIAFIEEKSGKAFQVAGHDSHGHGVHDAGIHGHEGTDPHIWLDMNNAMIMVDNIKDSFIQRDPKGRDYYEKNAAEYKEALRRLDEQFKKRLAGCKTRVFINGGHFAFGYLAARYRLTYISAYGFSPDAEPAPGQIVRITELLKKHKLKYIFHEELLMPRVAQAIARETGAELLFLHGAHNISREEFEQGVSFLQIMKMNLENLEKGLECRQ